jgi:type II restriction enzyme
MGHRRLKVRNRLSWKTEVRRCVQKHGKREFTLHDIYAYKYDLAEIFPRNQNVEAKIRQQLQFLRDDGFLEFIDNEGSYRLI